MIVTSIFRVPFYTALISILVTVWNFSVHANPAEVFDFGASQTAQAGAVSATVTDSTSGYYNPAGLVFGQGKRLSFGINGINTHLNANEQQLGDSQLSIVLGGATPLPFSGMFKNRIHVGFGFYLFPLQNITVIAKHPEEIHFIYYDERSRRLLILATLSAKLLDDLSVGVSVNPGAAVDGFVVTRNGPLRGLEAIVVQDISSVFHFNAGIRWQLLDNITLAFVYKEQFQLSYATDTQNVIEGEPLDVYTEANTLFSPSQFTLGTAWSVIDDLKFSLDVTIAEWSSYPAPFLNIRATIPLIDPFEAILPETTFNDTISIKLGTEWDFDTQNNDFITHYVLRSGYAFETSPVPQQTGVTNLLDGNKHTLAMGGGISLACNAAPCFYFDGYLRTQFLSHSETMKIIHDSNEPHDSFTSIRSGTEDSNPGYPSINSSGYILSTGITMGVRY